MADLYRLLQDRHNKSPLKQMVKKPHNTKARDFGFEQAYDELIDLYDVVKESCVESGQLKKCEYGADFNFQTEDKKYCIDICTFPSGASLFHLRELIGFDNNDIVKSDDIKKVISELVKLGVVKERE